MRKYFSHFGLDCSRLCYKMKFFGGRRSLFKLYLGQIEILEVGKEDKLEVQYRPDIQRTFANVQCERRLKVGRLRFSSTTNYSFEIL